MPEDYPGSGPPDLPVSAAGSPAAAMRERVPWRSVSASAAGLGAPLGAAALHPLLGDVVAIIELLLALTIFGTALFGSQALSERAFRLLRWFGNKPEPPPPTASDNRDGGPPVRQAGAQTVPQRRPKHKK
jgi:hypothetical protein